MNLTATSGTWLNPAVWPSSRPAAGTGAELAPGGPSDNFQPYSAPPNVALEMSNFIQSQGGASKLTPIHQDMICRMATYASMQSMQTNLSTSMASWAMTQMLQLGSRPFGQNSIGSLGFPANTMDFPLGLTGNPFPVVPPSITALQANPDSGVFCVTTEGMAKTKTYSLPGDLAVDLTETRYSPPGSPSISARRTSGEFQSIPVEISQDGKSATFQNGTGSLTCLNLEDLSLRDLPTPAKC